jgi:hypothetical protein
MRIRNHAIAAITLTGTVAILLSLPVRAARQESKAANSPQQNKPKAAPEMEKLNFYLGEWDYTEIYGKSTDGPRNTGVYTSKLGPGGNSLINTFHSRGPVGDFEGLQIFTWDPREKVYKVYVFGNDSPGALVETGAFEGETLVLHAEVGVARRHGEAPQFYACDRTGKARQRTIHVKKQHAGNTPGARRG